MPKLLLRIVGFLLIPGLIFGPADAAGFLGSAVSNRTPNPSLAAVCHFESQALVATSYASTVYPILRAYIVRMVPALAMAKVVNETTSIVMENGVAQNRATPVTATPAARPHALRMFIDVSDDLKSIRYYRLTASSYSSDSRQLLTGEDGQPLKPFLVIVADQESERAIADPEQKKVTVRLEGQLLLSPSPAAERIFRDHPNADMGVAWDFIQQNYGSRYTRYRGVTVSWDETIDRRVWTSNSDTVHIINRIHQSGVLSKSIRKVLEVGVGGGQISTDLVRSIPGLTDIFYSDIVPEALNVTTREIDEQKTGVTQHPYLGKGIASIDEKFDLIVVNPPYIPIPEFEDQRENDPYRGTGLIREILQTASERLNPDNPDAVMVMNVSSLTEQDLVKYVKEFGNDFIMDPLGDPLEVPLKINTMSDEWKDWFSRRGALTQYENASEHGRETYSHRIQTYRIRLKPRGAAPATIAVSRLRSLSVQAQDLSEREIHHALNEAFGNDTTRKNWFVNHFGGGESVMVQVWHAVLPPDLALPLQIKLLSFAMEVALPKVNDGSISINLRPLQVLLVDPASRRAITDLLSRYHSLADVKPNTDDAHRMARYFEWDLNTLEGTLTVGDNHYNLFHDTVLRPFLNTMEESGEGMNRWNKKTFQFFFEKVKAFAAQEAEKLSREDLEYYAPRVHDRGYYYAKKDFGERGWRSLHDQVKDKTDPFIGGELTNDLIDLLTSAAQAKCQSMETTPGAFQLNLSDIPPVSRVAFYQLAKSLTREEAEELVQATPETTRIFNSLARPWEALWQDAEHKTQWAPATSIAAQKANAVAREVAVQSPAEQQRLFLMNLQSNHVANTLTLARISPERLPSGHQAFADFMNKATHALWKLVGQYDGLEGFEKNPLVSGSYRELERTHPEELKKDEPLWRQVIRAKEMRSGVAPEVSARRLSHMIAESKVDAKKAGVVLYVGAGISMESGLPDWYTLRNYIVQDLLKNTGTAADDVGYVMNILEQNWRISPERSMKTLYEDLGGDILGSMRMLEMSHPAENHENIARLMSHGDLLQIISLNFDTLIERSAYACGMWRILPISLPGNSTRLDRIEIAQYTPEGQLRESSRRSVTLRDLKAGEIVLDGQRIRPFYVNDESLLGPEIFDQLTVRGIPVLHKPHGSSESGREHTIIADFEGVDRAFPEPVRRNLLQMMLGNVLASLGVTWRDPDLSTKIMFMASLVNEQDAEAAWMNEEQRLTVQTILKMKAAHRRDRGLLMEAFPRLIPEQVKALQMFEEGAAGQEESLSAVIGKADPILEALARERLSVVAPVRSPAEKAGQLDSTRRLARQVLERWADAFVGHASAQKQGVVYSVMKVLQESDPSCQFEQEKKVFGIVPNGNPDERIGGDSELRMELAGLSKEGQRRNRINQKYPLEQIVQSRADRYRRLWQKELLTEWQYNHLMSNLYLDQLRYHEASPFLKRLTEEKEDGTPLSTEPWQIRLTELLQDPQKCRQELGHRPTRESLLNAWREQRLKLNIFAEQLKLNLTDSELPLPAADAIDQTRTVLRLFHQVFHAGASVLSQGDARTAERLHATSEEMQMYLEIFRIRQGRESASNEDTHRHYLEQAWKFRYTTGKGGDLSLLLEAYVTFFHHFTETGDLEYAREHLAQAQAVASLLNLPESHPMVRQLKTYEAYYLLLRSWKGDKTAANRIWEIASNRDFELMHYLKEITEKDNWLMISDLLIQAVWERGRYRFTEGDRQDWQRPLSDVMDWFQSKAAASLSDRDLSSLFHIFTALFDLRYLQPDLVSYESIQPNFSGVLEKLVKLTGSRIGAVGNGTIPKTNYEAIFAYHYHQQSLTVSSASDRLEALQQAETAYQKAIDAAKKAPHIARQMLLLTQLYVDQGLYVQQAQSDGALGALIASESASGYFSKAAAVMEKMTQELAKTGKSIESLGDKRLLIKRDRFHSILQSQNKSVPQPMPAYSNWIDRLRHFRLTELWRHLSPARSQTKAAA